MDFHDVIKNLQQIVFNSIDAKVSAFISKIHFALFQYYFSFSKYSWNYKRWSLAPYIDIIYGTIFLQWVQIIISETLLTAEHESVDQIWLPCHNFEKKEIK